MYFVCKYANTGFTCAQGSLFSHDTNFVAALVYFVALHH